MADDSVIDVQSVSKRFSKNQKSTRKQVKRIFKECFFGVKKEEVSTLTDGEFWALDNVTFSIKKNENIAILGNNGAGKSTLLKMLNGIFLPDHGVITIKGSVASVLELSTGFRNELSGLENIYLKCSMLGVEKEQVEILLDEIISFSELEEFIETPLDHYSSGMKARLGFAIVVHLQPDILILDEVFAVGDKNFRKKSERAISALSEKTTTIIVSHNMGIVKNMANRVIVLNKGKLQFLGDVEEGVEFYNSMI